MDGEIYDLDGLQLLGDPDKPIIHLARLKYSSDPEAKPQGAWVALCGVNPKLWGTPSPDKVACAACVARLTNLLKPWGCIVTLTGAGGGGLGPPGL